MKKYASEFNELIVLAEKEKTKKKGGSLGSVFKLVQDLIDFEENIQEAIDAQEMAENKSKIESFLADIDKMYAVLLDIAKEGIAAARSQRMVVDQVEETEEVVSEPVPEVSQPEDDTRISTDELKKQLEMKPKSPVSVSIPSVPKM
jgi:hypothetical protein